MLSAAGVQLAAGGILTSIGAAQAQIASSETTGSAGIFGYCLFDLGFALLWLGARWGLLAVVSSAARSAGRRTTPLLIETDYGVYSHEYQEGLLRRLRVRVVNTGPEELFAVRVRLVGGHPIRAADYLRAMGDDASPYAESRAGVTLPGYQHRYFLLVEVDEGRGELSLGFANDLLVSENILQLPPGGRLGDDGTFAMLVAEGRRVADGTFVAMAYENVEIANFHSVVGLQPMAPAGRLYDGPTKAHDRMRLP